MVSTLLQMNNVSLGYTQEPILAGVNLSIEPGQLVVITGTSGCGKSTLLKGSVGLLKPLAGSVHLLGKDLATLDETELMKVRSRVGLLFQGGALLNSMTVAENIALPLQLHSSLPSKAKEKLVRMKLAMVGLEHTWSMSPSELSGGMRKRVALARAMVMDPDILFCDEPSAGLDPVTAAALDRLLLDLRSGLNVTLVVVTHELSSIEVIADRMIMVAEGSIVFDGSLDEARSSSHPSVQNFLQRKASRPDSAGLSVLQRFDAGGEVTS